MKKIRVLIVDDSTLFRLMLDRILSSDPEIEVIGHAADPYEAREKIKRSPPDVITLDIEMPKMDGITFLKNLMRLRPIPVVMISSLTHKGADITIQALALGAIDFVCKPRGDLKHQLDDYSDEIINKVKSAANANIIPAKHNHTVTSRTPVHQNNRFEVIAFGASTGGVEAIKTIVRQLPLGLPPIVVVQHIPDVFSTSFAKRLDNMTELKVIEVRQAIVMQPSHVYISPGDDHLFVERVHGKLVVNINHNNPVNLHRPSIDIMFESIAKTSGKRSIGVILTGMGRDGVNGLLQIKRNNGITIAQDKESSVVWGMPGAAIASEAASKVISLDRIAEALVRMNQ